MAVTNFHYITRMNSGFKVYILEGQPSLRTEDRYRHLAHRAGVPPVYPIKRKHSPERGPAVEDRAVKVRRSSLALISKERALFGSATRSFQRQPSLSPATPPQTPTVTTTTRSPARRLPSPLYAGPPMDEPLALIKKPGYCSPTEGTVPSMDAKPHSPTTTRVQIRPSVITCVSSSARAASSSPEVRSSPCSSASSPPACDPVVEEHFRRSLGLHYREADSSALPVSVSVDDHFAKALGDKWLKLRASSSPGSPSYGSSPSRGYSPHSPHSPAGTSSP
uniref:Vestigial like 4 like n=1 Tax=Lepisosteus oculatus TaxID=7918 RepID=W5NAT4_LEPOC|nr:PREDICTED: transcription cofactor vestigial-like protein 4 [Lepisosteus oculatus]